MVGSRVLVVDDEPTVREVVAGYLTRDGFDVTEAADGRAALNAMSHVDYDMLIVDLMLPDINGLDVLREARRHDGDIAVIVLTGRAEESDRVIGLELGADDYVVKPFSPRELSARVRSVLRRTGAPSRSADELPGVTATSVLRFGDLSVDVTARFAHVGSVEIELTAKEFDLLAFLAGHPKQVFSRAQLLDQVWDSSIDYQDPATVTVHIGRLRQKLERQPEQPRWLTTVWGVGYRFDP